MKRVCVFALSSVWTFVKSCQILGLALLNNESTMLLS